MAPGLSQKGNRSPRREPPSADNINPHDRRLEEVTNELKKYQELLSQDSQPRASVATVETSPVVSQNVVSQTYTMSPSNATNATSTSPSSVAAMDVLTSGVCYRPEEYTDDMQLGPYILGSEFLDREAAAELFQQ